MLKRRGNFPANWEFWTCWPQQTVIKLIFNHSDSFVWYCEECQMNVNNFDTFWKIHLCQKNPNWTLSCMITYTNQHSST